MEIQSSVSPRSTYSTIFAPSKPKPIYCCRTHSAKPFKNPQFSLSSYSYSDHTKPSLPLPLKSQHFHPNPPRKSIKQTTLFVEKYHLNQQLQSLIGKLKEGNLSPLQVLERDGDWNKTQFWAVVKFLQQISKLEDIPKLFNAWTKLERSRINEFNYNKIIGLLSEAGMMDEVVLALQDMKTYGLQLCSEVYNSIIHGYAQKGKIDDALFYLKEMEESNVSPDTETYDGLIKAYGKLQMYDEMIGCLKTMESKGFSPDHITLNLLICELAKGGLLGRMERMYQSLISKKMKLQSSTLVTMLEAYADFRVLEKMERLYIKVANSKVFPKDRLIRKIARVYVENYMFSKLDDLANDIALRIGKTDLFWCLHLLPQACLPSKKGMNSVIREMEEAEVPWSITLMNIILLSYLKMKDFTQLGLAFSDLPSRHVQPDIVTLGILYDAHNAGFDWYFTLKTWRKYGYFENSVEVKTDPLVFTAFGKGLFLSVIEEMHSLLEPKIREKRRWTYGSLVDFVLKHHKYQPELAEDN